MSAQLITLEQPFPPWRTISDNYGSLGEAAGREGLARARGHLDGSVRDVGGEGGFQVGDAF